MQTVFKGVNYDEREQEIAAAPAEKEKNIKKLYPINNMSIQKLEYNQDKGLKPITTENIEFSAAEYSAINNGKIYFSVNSVNRIFAVPPKMYKRTNPVSITRGYIEEDDIVYTIPPGYLLYTEPLNISIDKSFGNFKATTVLNGDQLIYERRLQLKDGTYPKDVYADLVDFYQSVENADNYNVTLVRK
jgi:hypothetical protein